jgi:hypothetical protein
LFVVVCKTLYPESVRDSNLLPTSERSPIFGSFFCFRRSEKSCIPQQCGIRSAIDL